MERSFLCIKISPTERQGKLLLLTVEIIKVSYVIGADVAIA